MTAITADTSEALMVSAIEGRLSKHTLASLLTPEARSTFLRACANVERRLTDACGAAGDPCLESGCSCEGEVCLEPVLRAGTEYLEACGAEWVRFFADAQNRNSTWRRIAADCELEGNSQSSKRDGGHACGDQCAQTPVSACAVCPVTN